MLDRVPTSPAFRRRRPLCSGPRSRPRRRPEVEPLEGRLLLAGGPAVETAQERMAAFGLRDIKGLCYTPEPSDDHEKTPAAYFDSDFWNNAFTPMWSSQRNIPGFKTAGGPVEGRGDLATIRSLGVNFLHIYDWNPQRDHRSFLAAAKADGITVNVPISNYIFGLARNAPLRPNTFVFELEYVQQIFNQVYPNWQRGDRSPTPGISMWTIANEPDISGITPAQVAHVAQMVVYCEDHAKIPDKDRLPIAIPLSWATSWSGTSYHNPTPSVGAVEALDHAFNTTTGFIATGIGGQKVDVPRLSPDFFATRFVWANNPVGNRQTDFFLGVKTVGAPYAPYNHPQGASDKINWNGIPMFFTEVGPSSAEHGSNPAKQAEILQNQLVDVAAALKGGRDPEFGGAAVFQSLDQVAHKTGAETGFGIETFNTNVFQTIMDVPPTVVPAGGAGTWRLDKLVHKPAFDVVQDAFKG